MKHKIVVTLTILILCVACEENRVYHHYCHTPIEGWEKVEALSFEVPPLAQAGRYATNLELRTNNSYPYMSLALIVEQTVYPSMKQRVDTLMCPLVDSHGNAKSNGVSYCQYRFTVSQTQLHKADSLHIVVRHNMQRDILPGIADVGIAVDKVDK
ncbi:gliding motility lipoprotein GldH [Hallella colorans]|jgi:hypothetical protein|uniref:gliding motility lipoprotein GldH n=1 Tax=Hallella colorans TaxID=1703337 RepID=UPI0023F334C6|nr:gliding motility lipoprotein GldH [Hallella colorans]